MKPPVIILIIVSALLTCLVGCVDKPIHQPPIASHVGVDQAINAVRTSQQEASQKVKIIEKAVTDPATKQMVQDLNGVIDTLGLNIDNLTGKVNWYEGQYGKLWSDDDKKTKIVAAQEITIVSDSKIITAGIVVIAAIITFTIVWNFKKQMLAIPPPWLGLVILLAVTAGVFSASCGLLLRTAHILSTPFPALFGR